MPSAGLGQLDRRPQADRRSGRSRPVKDAGFEHGTQKPVECMKRPIENNSSPGQAVYEPFSGSGTTIIAAEMTGRSCHAIELTRQYVDVAVERWQAFTGAEATLEGDGRTFFDDRRGAPAFQPDQLTVTISSINL